MRKKYISIRTNTQIDKYIDQISIADLSPCTALVGCFVCGVRLSNEAGETDAVTFGVAGLFICK